MKLPFTATTHDYLGLYDIQEDRARTKAAKVCKRAGLYRVQQSCFLGTLDGVAARDTLQLQLEALIDETWTRCTCSA